jgi:hypothetical protein
MLGTMKDVGAYFGVVGGALYDYAGGLPHRLPLPRRSSMSAPAVVFHSKPTTLLFAHQPSDPMYMNIYHRISLP